MTVFLTFFGRPDTIEKFEGVTMLDKLDNGHLLLLMKINHPARDFVGDVIEVILKGVVTCEVN